MTGLPTIPAWVEGELRPVDKIAAHRLGLKHQAVSVFLLHGDEILIQQRALDKYHTPGLWANTCCTHPHWGEDPADCAARRLGEELGIRGVVPFHSGRVEYRAEVGQGMVEHEVADIFIAQVGANLAVTPNPAEVMAVRWISLADLRVEIDADPGRFTPWLRIYLARHSAEIFDGLL